MFVTLAEGATLVEGVLGVLLALGMGGPGSAGSVVGKWLLVGGDGAAGPPELLGVVGVGTGWVTSGPVDCPVVSSFPEAPEPSPVLPQASNAAVTKPAAAVSLAQDRAFKLYRRLMTFEYPDSAAPIKREGVDSGAAMTIQ